MHMYSNISYHGGAQRRQIFSEVVLGTKRLRTNPLYYDSYHCYRAVQHGLSILLLFGRNYKFQQSGENVHLLAYLWYIIIQNGKCNVLLEINLQRSLVFTIQIYFTVIIYCPAFCSRALMMLAPLSHCNIHHVLFPSQLCLGLAPTISVN